MRSILVQTARDPLNSARLDSAMEIARAHEGHVTLLIDTPVDRFVTVDPYGGTYVAHEALDAAIAQDDALAQLIEGRLASGGVPFDVVKFERTPLDALLEAGKDIDYDGAGGAYDFDKNGDVLGYIGKFVVDGEKYKQVGIFQ